MYKSLDELYKAYSWKSASKFIPLAEKHGFSSADARRYLKHSVEHDIIPEKPKFMHIYSKSGDAYQMDTFINDRKKEGLNYLILININTRKAYAYPLVGKGSVTVLNALNEFIKAEPKCKSITSDQDSAYLKDIVLDFMKLHNINYRTTEDNNHNVLGIINRFMRTVRDYFIDNHYITPQEMMKFINTYNNSPHSSLNNKAPNDITDKEEADYIKTMSNVNPYKFMPGESVKVINVRTPFTKHRSNVSKEAYIIDSRTGNQFIIRAEDDSIDKHPGYQLVKTKSKNIANTIKDGKRGIVDKIVSYNIKNDSYKVIYQGGVEDNIKAKVLRESNPTQLSDMERRYWSKHLDNIPDDIKKWI